MKNARVEKGLTIETSDKVGVAGELTQIFKNANLNIKSLLAEGANGKGHFVVISEDSDKAKEILGNSPFSSFKENDVIVVNVDDAVGTCSDVTGALGDANVNINFLYTTIFDNEAAIVLSTEDNQQAISVLNA